MTKRTDGTETPAARRARVIGDAILDAGVRVLAEQGWGDFTLANVARAAGYSKRPVHNRYHDRLDLAIDVWEQRFWPVGQNLLATVFDELGKSRLSGDPEPLVDAIAKFTIRNPLSEAGIEIILYSAFEPRLRDVVMQSVGRDVAAVCDIENAPADAARYAYALMLLLGCRLGSRMSVAKDVDLKIGLRNRSLALLTDLEPQTIPPYRAKHLDEHPVLDANNPALNALLNAALDQIGKFGFNGTSVTAIAKAAGYTEGLVFSHYNTKLEMFLDATRRKQAFSFRANEEFFELVAKNHDSAIAEAVVLQEMQFPGREGRRALSLEQLRLAWHTPELQKATDEVLENFREEYKKAHPKREESQNASEFFVSYALGLGATAMPLLMPDCHKLSYDVVTRALHNLQSLNRQSRSAE